MQPILLTVVNKNRPTYSTNHNLRTVAAYSSAGERHEIGDFSEVIA